MSFGAFLQKSREKRKKTQAEVATDIGCTQAAVAYWEADKAIPEATKWPAIASAYGVSLAALVKLIAKRVAA